MDDSPRTGREDGHRVNAFRWLCVFPVAYLASWLFGGVAVFLLSSFGVELRGSGHPEFVFPFLQKLPSGIAFTLVGALVAPARNTATATVLVSTWIPLSLVIHIFGQSNPGLTNFMHATGESLGAVVGLAMTWHINKPPSGRAYDPGDDSIRR